MRSVFILVILSLFVLTACKKKESDNSDQGNSANLNSGLIVISTDQFKQSEMTLGTIKPHVFDNTVQASGLIDVPPQYKASVTAKMGGFIKETSLLEGNRVTKGQFLVSVENPEFVKLQQSYLEIKERLGYLETEFKRQKTLFDEKIISEKSYLKAESDYKSAKATYMGLRKQLQILNISLSQVDQGILSSVSRIYAPIDGNISSINILKGSPVSPDTIIMEIIDNSHIHIELSVFEKDILKIKKGQLIRYKIPESDSEWYSAHVYLVGSALEENRTITVHAHPEDESMSLLPGMFISAEIIVDSIELPALPNTGIIEVDGKHYVLKLQSQEEGQYEFQQIRVSLTNTDKSHGSFSEINDFSHQDQFLLTGGYALIGE